VKPELMERVKILRREISEEKLGRDSAAARLLREGESLNWELACDAAEEIINYARRLREIEVGYAN
jgi:hypothetical protein